MNAQQFQQLLQAARPPAASRRLETFSTGDPMEWATWRSNFEITATINGWDDQRQRREIGAAMTGLAKQWTRDIALGDGAAVVAVAAGLLDAYQDRFLPEAESDKARISFRDARQQEAETVIAWHSRLRYTFKRAYPALGDAAVEASRDLRDTFILGLANTTVKTDTWKARPLTYAACLEQANNYEASTIVLSKFASGSRNITAIQDSGPRFPSDDSSLSAVSDPNNCYRCNRPGHIRRDCRTNMRGGRGGNNPASYNNNRGSTRPRFTGSNQYNRQTYPSFQPDSRPRGGYSNRRTNNQRGSRGYKTSQRGGSYRGAPQKGVRSIQDRIDYLEAATIATVRLEEEQDRQNQEGMMEQESYDGFDYVTNGTRGQQADYDMAYGSDKENC